MLARRFLKLLCSLVAGSLTGCAGLRPDHITAFGEHDEAQTTGGVRAARTATNKVGVTATYDFPHDR